MKSTVTLEHFFNDLAQNLEPYNLYAPVNYIMSQGGKRIRPQLVLLAAELFGATTENAFMICDVTVY